MKEYFFIRHGQTLWNAIRRMQGQWNSDLSELGREQANVNGKLLSSLEIEAVFASPLNRTRQTARIINRYLDLPVTFDDRIKEWDCGDWSGFLYAEVQERWQKEWAAREANVFHYRGPNCENYPDMIARSTPFLEELHVHPARRIAIVSHGMIGRVMVSMLMGYDEEQTLAFHQPNDKVFRVTHDGEDTQIHHFAAGEGPFPGID